MEKNKHDSPHPKTDISNVDESYLYSVCFAQAARGNDGNTGLVSGKRLDLENYQVAAGHGKGPVGHTDKQRQKKPTKNLLIYCHVATDLETQEPENYFPVRNKDGHFGLGFNINGKTIVFNQ